MGFMFRGKVKEILNESLKVTMARSKKKVLFPETSQYILGLIGRHIIIIFFFCRKT